MLSALRLPGVRWILAVHGMDLALEYASSVALMVLVYDATNSPLAAAAMLVCKQVVPGALLASLGSRLEQRDPRRPLLAAYLMRGLAFALFAIVSHGAALYALAFAAGVAGTTTRVLLRATVVRSITGEAFRQASAAQNIVFTLVALLGPALGALVAGAVGASASLSVWALAAGALGAATLSMPSALRTSVAHGAAQVDADEAPATPTGISAPAWSLLVLAGLLTCAFAMDEPALLAYVQSSLGAGVGVYGTILVLWGIGMVLGGAAYSRLGVGAPFTVIVAGVLASATGYLGLGLAPSVGVAYAAAVIGGIGNGSYWVVLVTAYLERADHGDAAAASGRFEGTVTATAAVGIVVGGLVAQVIGPRPTLWIPGAIAVVALTAWAALDRASGRHSAPVVVAAPTHEPAAPVGRPAHDPAPAMHASAIGSPVAAEVLA